MTVCIFFFCKENSTALDHDMIFVDCNIGLDHDDFSPLSAKDFDSTPAHYN